MDDLRHAHPGQTEAKHKLLPTAHIAVIADAQQRAVRLVVGEPPGRVLPCSLPYSGGVARNGFSRLCSSSTSAGSAS
ncbi:MAG: hypothetical protein ACRDZY_05705, partial [Acidimicrobiales bacterium]